MMDKLKKQMFFNLLYLVNLFPYNNTIGMPTQKPSIF